MAGRPRGEIKGKRRCRRGFYLCMSGLPSYMHASNCKGTPACAIINSRCLDLSLTGLGAYIEEAFLLGSRVYLCTTGLAPCITAAFAVFGPVHDWSGCVYIEGSGGTGAEHVSSPGLQVIWGKRTRSLSHIYLLFLCNYFSIQFECILDTFLKELQVIDSIALFGVNSISVKQSCSGMELIGNRNTGGNLRLLLSLYR